MLQSYLLFLAECATVVIALLLLSAGLFALVRGGGKGNKGKVQISDLGREIRSEAAQLIAARLDKKAAKAWRKAQKRAAKAKTGEDGPCTWVLDFKGDLRASALTNLREEITALLAAQQPGDRVLLRLESGGGMVNAYGLAAAQLLRLHDAGVPLSIAVDNVAASGGYLMAVVADEIIASPFALLGSIGVIAQIPNFHRWLKDRNVDFEQVTAGRFKRTVSLFGETTEAGREKLREELEEIHGLFRDFVGRFRPQLDMEQVATGEAWLGTRALELGLVDSLSTSDAWLSRAAQEGKVLGLQVRSPQTLPQRLGLKTQQVWEGLWSRPLP